MTEPSDQPTPLVKAADLLDQLGAELAFVEPGKDAGLLPINSLVMDLEELLIPNASPPISSGLAAARRWLDLILDGAGKFDSASIGRLSEWHAWMNSTLSASRRGTIAPAVPASWGVSGDSPLQTPASPGTFHAPSAGDNGPIGSDTAIHLNLQDDIELLREFHSESLELLQAIEQGVLQLEKDPAEPGTIHTIFRAFHTFKGGAGFLHLDALRDVAHELESLLDAARRSQLKITSSIIDLILAGADVLKHFTREIGTQLNGVNSGSPILVSTQDLIRRVRAALERTPAPGTGATGQPTPGLAVKEAALEAEPASPLPSQPPSNGRAASLARESSETTTRPDSAAGFVKLDTGKLDNLVDLVGELVITQSMVAQDPEVRKLSSRHLSRCLRQLGKITTELQRTAMSLRMVPIRRTFQKMTRLVRDLAGQQQKQVHLICEGEETELDRNIVEELSDPLAHMIRNAIDHGIEPPADRVARGKPPLGTIRLSAAHQGGGIVIQIQDDGKGLVKERLLAKALERGLVKPGAVLTDAEIFALIFAPGFSTADKVTDVSGRGVGMDVVRRNIEKLHGKVEIESVPGQGARFTIVLPLTLAIIDGMLIGVGEDRYIIPTLSVLESFRPRPGMVSTVHGKGEVVSVRGRLTPLLRLGQRLGTPGGVTDPTQGIIVVVESGGIARGLLVDELLGKQEVVIKSLGRIFARQDLLAGAAILGDGRVGLILDVDTLVKCQCNHH